MIQLPILEMKNASLNTKIDKLNELISSLRTENASLISKAKELNVCNDSISSLRNKNAILNANPLYLLLIMLLFVLDVEMLMLML